jgi:hypothetical protein
MAKQAQPLSAVDQRELAAMLIRAKQIRGEKINAKELSTLERWNKDYQAAVLTSALRGIPKGVYCQMAGRQQKVVDEFGARYDVPLGSPTVDMFQVVKALHSRVSELAATARPHLDIDDAELQREKLRQEIAKLERQSEILRIDIQTKLSELVSKAVVAERLEWLSGRLRSLGTRLHRVAGEEGQTALNEFLEQLAIEIDGGALAV